MTGLDAPAETANRPQRWRLSLPAALIAIIALTGVCAWTYPTAAAWITQLDQSKIIRNATSDGPDPKAPANAQALRQAESYNDALEAGASLEANERLPHASGVAAGVRKYDEILVDPTGVMSRLQIPTIKLDLPVYHGTSDDTLLKGLGHLEGTALPVGGVGTNTVITGHRGLAEAEMFTKLNQIAKGDRFTITTFGRVMTYEVIETKVVDPGQTEALDPNPNRDLATLVTCTPLGINTQRILVIGQRIHPTPADDIRRAERAPDIPGFPWWSMIIGGAVIAAGTYVWLSGRPVKPAVNSAEVGKRSRSRH